MTHATRTGGPISGHKPWPAGGQPAEQADEKPAPRREVTYRCASGHATVLVFAVLWSPMIKISGRLLMVAPGVVREAASRSA